MAFSPVSIRRGGHSRVRGGPPPPPPPMVSARRPHPLRPPTAAAAVPFIVLEPQTFDITRRLFLRGLGLLYGTAFLVAHNQNLALIGDEGITPARDVLERNGGDDRDSPTLLSLLFRRRRGAGQPSTERVRLDPWLQGFSLAGMALSAVPLLTGTATMPLLFALWTLYFSIVSVGNLWYAYMWESQLLETGFLALWSVPLLPSSAMPPAWFPVLGFRWLLFRVMLGSGLIKLRPSSSPCWKCWRKGQASCMEYFYETQPVPSPLSRRLHFMPPWFHTGSTYTNHVVEVLLPWLLLLPPLLGTPFRTWAVWGGGVAQISFQAMLCASGNLSFLNALTMLPAIWLLDDAFFKRVASWVPPLFRSGSIGTISSTLGTTTTATATSTAATAIGSAIGGSGSAIGGIVRRHGLPLCVALLLAWKSAPVVQNLRAGLSRRGKQVMNASFDRWRLVNTYGAFGFVGEERDEMVIKGTRGGWDAPDDEWREFEFAVKPGTLSRGLPTIVPYHHRLDWCTWIAALRPPESSPWLRAFFRKLLENDEATSRLLAGPDGRGNPFLHDGGGPPKFLKVERYRYRFTRPGHGGGGGGGGGSGSGGGGGSGGTNVDEKGGQGKSNGDGLERGRVWERELLGRYFPRTPIFSALMLGADTDDRR